MHRTTQYKIHQELNQLVNTEVRPILSCPEGHLVSVKLGISGTVNE